MIPFHIISITFLSQKKKKKERRKRKGRNFSNDKKWNKFELRKNYSQKFIWQRKMKSFAIKRSRRYSMDGKKVTETNGAYITQ